MAAQLSTIESFLAPVLKRDAIVKARGQSIIERISSNDPSIVQNGQGPRSAVVRRALQLLSELHQALCKDPDVKRVQEVLFTSSSRRLIDGLLDLISLEGIYPNLLPGLGVPIERRLKSVLQGGTVTQLPEGTQSPEHDEDLLLQIANQLSAIGMSSGEGLCGALQKRTLVDLIAVKAQFAFSPKHDTSNGRHALTLKALLDRIPSSVLFPILTSLIHPATPDWLKEPISISLSLLPLRPGGVRDTIVFIASAATQTGSQSVQSEAASGLVFSLEILNHAAKVLSSVPSKVTSTYYFATLAPQLFALLDEEGTDMQRAAAYVIGNGVIGRRKYGAPRSAGWMAFVEPIFKPLLPGVLSETFQSTQKTEVNTDVIVHSDDVYSAVHRLAALILIHPNPGLVARLVGPLLLSIWAVACRSHASTSQTAMNHKAIQILVTYISVSAGATGLIKLADNLLWDGGLDWKFGLDHTGRLEIRRRPQEYREIEIQAITATVDEGIRNYIELQNQARSDSDLLDVFAHLVSCWLLGSGSGLNQGQRSAIRGSWEDAVRALTYAKLTQDMLEKHKDKISANPDQILKLLQRVLTAYVTKAKQHTSNREKSQHVTMASISSIVQPADAPVTPAEEESEEIVSVSLGLLDALLPFRSSDTNPSTLTALRSILGTLTHLTALDRVPSSIRLSATNTVSQISRLLHDSLSPNSAADPTLSPHASALATHAVALQNLVSPLPPIRAEGLASLTNLIISSSPVLDIPSTTILLLSLLQDDEEFIYLAAIKALGLLAQKHSKTVTRMLIERYVDQKEEGGLEVRLRTGEALQATVSSLGPMLHGYTAALVGEGLISIAGRRGTRPKTAEERRKRNLVAERENMEAEMAWGGEVPSLDEIDGDQDEAAARIADVLLRWEGQEGEEDVRIRASALSILGVACETNASGLGANLVSISVDLAVSILKLETAEEKAILRRASVLLMMSIIRGIDKSDEQDPNLNYQVWFPGERIHEFMEVLVYLERAEKDIIVKGHFEEVLQGIRDYMANEWRRLNGEGSGEIRFSLEGQLRGLDVNPERNTNERGKPRIEEVE
ncbi:hypothetical protein MMC30_003650 [Trapelia coarctata]|nr:hypothetical protein [Trapelia coarctata]